MCGRCACTLNPETLVKACGYRESKTGTRKPAKWHELESTPYLPSQNKGPKTNLPCLIAGRHVDLEEERVLCPMQWSLIPHFVKDIEENRGNSHHNARLENIELTKLFSTPLKEGRRCIAVIDGFYEWKKSTDKNGTSQPFYIHLKQDEGVIADDTSTWKDEWDQETGWKGYKVLKIAGLFNRLIKPDKSVIYSFTMITTEENGLLERLHHRMPVILRDEEDVKMWLDIENVRMQDALAKLRLMKIVKGDLEWYPVSTEVNKIQNQGQNCRTRIIVKEPKKSGSSLLMSSWLQKGKKDLQKSEDLKEPPKKKIKKG